MNSKKQVLKVRNILQKGLLDVFRGVTSEEDASKKIKSSREIMRIHKQNTDEADSETNAKFRTKELQIALRRASKKAA